jgi:hypothetical protein
MSKVVGPPDFNDTCEGDRHAALALECSFTSGQVGLVSKRSTIEERLTGLSKLRETPRSPTRAEELQRALLDKVNVVVAKAAQIAGDLGESDLVPSLIQAFDRLMVNPSQTDKGCLAKTKIMKALGTLECEREGIFLKGIRHFQLEPAYGGPVDTACELRIASALGLVQMGFSGALTELVTLMTDKEVEARVGAVRALAHTGRDEAVLLLRFKVLTGDPEPTVISECFTALMKLSPRNSLALIADFIDPAHPALCESAALALGESRLPEAFELLKQKWEVNCHSQFRRTLLLPIALLRQEAGLDFLLSVITTNDFETASAAITALALYRQDSKVQERLRTVLAAPQQARLRKVFEREFATSEDR